MANVGRLENDGYWFGKFWQKRLNKFINVQSKIKKSLADIEAFNLLSTIFFRSSSDSIKTFVSIEPHFRTLPFNRNSLTNILLLTSFSLKSFQAKRQLGLRKYLTLKILLQTVEKKIQHKLFFLHLLCKSIFFSLVWFPYVCFYSALYIFLQHCTREICKKIRKFKSSNYQITLFHYSAVIHLQKKYATLLLFLWFSFYMKHETFSEEEWGIFMATKWRGKNINVRSFSIKFFFLLWQLELENFEEFSNAKKSGATHILTILIQMTRKY